MRFSKTYGESKLENCPFCGKQAIYMNEQGIPVCNLHKPQLLPEMKCICGEYMLSQKGKFGVFFSCLTCGNMSLSKALSINPIKQENRYVEQEKKEIPKEIIIRSDDPDYFD